MEQFQNTAFLNALSLILRTKDPTYTYAIYVYYCVLLEQQKVNPVYTSSTLIANLFKCNASRVAKARRILKQLDLIKDIRKLPGKDTRFCVQVNFAPDINHRIPRSRTAGKKQKNKKIRQDINNPSINTNSENYYALFSNLNFN